MKRRTELILRLAKKNMKLEGNTVGDSDDTCKVIDEQKKEDTWKVIDAQEEENYVSSWIQQIPNTVPVSENCQFLTESGEYTELLPAAASTSRNENNEKMADQIGETINIMTLPMLDLDVTDPASGPDVNCQMDNTMGISEINEQETEEIETENINLVQTVDAEEQETEEIETENINLVQTADAEDKTDTLKFQPELKKKKRKKMNIRQLNKGLKYEGKAYMTRDMKMKDAKSVKPGCGEKCKLHCSEKISEEARSELFKIYWALGSLQRQREYIKDSVLKVCCQYPRVALKKTRNRSFNFSYHFLVGGEKIRVCQHFFMSTLDINARVIQTVRQKTTEAGVLEIDRRGTNSLNVKKVPPEIQSSIVRHIASLPRVESHYCRQKSSCVYIDGSRSLADLHRDYEAYQKENNASAGTYDQYRRFFSEYNLKFFKPKKDQCEDCVAYSLLTNEQKEEEGVKKVHTDHLEQKELAREEKNHDKTNTPSSTVVCVYDLQAVMSCPQGEASPFYYVSKLGVYNFTIVNLKSGNASCYVWDETQAKRGSVEIGSCVLKYLQMLNDTTEENLEVIFFSDNCCGQQKNQFLQSVYHYAVRKLSKIHSITHKFLIKGHTQNEGDAVHSIIERNVARALKAAPVYHPSQYIQLIRTAKKKNTPLNVVEMSYHDFINVKELKSGPKLKMHDVHVMHFDKKQPYAVKFKNKYGTDYEEVVLELKRTSGKKNKQNKEDDEPTRMYKECLRVPEKKKTDFWVF